MLGILYGAEKYMLPELIEQTAAYVLERTNETNCLEIFNAIHLLGCAELYRKCVQLFQQDPMKFFGEDSFMQLCLSALKRLAGLQKMNCTGTDLKQAVCSWLVINKGLESIDGVDDKVLLKHGFPAVNFQGKRFQSLSREGDHLMVINKFQSNITTIQIPIGRKLFGVGLCVGVSGAPEDESVKLTISQNKEVIQTVERKVKQSENSSVMEIMFRQLTILPGTFSIKMEFETEKSRFTTSSICTEQQHYVYGNDRYHDSLNKRRLTKTFKTLPVDPGSPFSCLAYLIYASPQI
jgi:hypothetical protein